MNWSLICSVSSTASMLALVTALSFCLIPVSADNASFSISPLRIDDLLVGSEALVEGNVSLSGESSISSFIITATVEDNRVLEVMNLSLSSSEEKNVGFMRLLVIGRRLGETRVSFFLSPLVNGTPVKLEEELPVIVLRVVTIHTTIFQILNIICIVVVIFFMGCELDPRIIIGYVRRPFAPCIGFFSQFILMPLIATAIGLIMPMPPEFGFGLLTVGCSPGGGNSNVWTILLKGDVNLSMTMTFISSICAIGMMPLWLFVLGRFFIDQSDVFIPYSSIALDLLQVIIPSLLGVILNWWKPRLAKHLNRFLQPSAIIYLIILLIYGTYTNAYLYELILDYPIVIPAGAMLPYFGFSIGFLLASLFRLGWARSITVSLETCCQNVGIATLILLYSMPKPTGEMAAVIPLVVICLTPIPLFIILAVMRTRAWLKRRRTEEETHLISNDVKLIQSEKSRRAIDDLSVETQYSTEGDRMS